MKKRKKKKKLVKKKGKRDSHRGLSRILVEMAGLDSRRKYIYNKRLGINGEQHGGLKESAEAGRCDIKIQQGHEKTK